MPCTNLLKGWALPNGGITFNKQKSPSGIPMEVPCGQCWSCRLARSREWALRLVKEAQFWPEEKRVFLTLTYNNENLPKDGSLDVEHFQNFMKALRYHFSSLIPAQNGKDKRIFPKIKYFHCGEYGETCKNCGDSYILHEESKSKKKYNDCKAWVKGLGRPHYHAIIYGISFDDMEVYKRTKADEIIYKSKTLEEIWGKGFCTIGNVTFESCAYVARYIMKKITGDKAESHYIKQIGIDESTGEVITNPVKPEYITMSRNPAIAKEWCEKYLTDIKKNDAVLLSRQGKSFETKPPRYFMKQLQKSDLDAYERIKQKRRETKNRMKADTTEERNLVKERIKKIQTKNLNRHFEDYHES
jgi:hypothetical protein